MTMQIADSIIRPPMVVPLSVEQYHQMISTGILSEGEPIELLDGLLIRKDRSHAGDDPMTVGPLHFWAIKQLEIFGRQMDGHGCHIRLQAPVTLPPDNEPEPDGAVARGTSHDFLHRHPSAGDLLCVIEVADSSLGSDRVTKQRVYADAGIPEFILINLVEDIIEHRSNPSVGTGKYDQTAILRRGDILKIPMADGTSLAVPVEKLLP